MKKVLIVLLTFLSFNTLSAQEPTLSETTEYIKLKTANAKLWYNNSSEVSSKGCVDEYANFLTDITSIEFKDKQLQYKSKCGASYGTPDSYGTVIIYLERVKSVQVIDESLVLTSSMPLFDVVYKQELIQPSTPTKIKFNRLENPEKLLKAFNHLFKLHNIKLLDDKF